MATITFFEKTGCSGNARQKALLAAPAIKSGEIVPEELDEPTALALLRDNPLLIRRPLLQVGEKRKVGFDATAVHAWISLKDVPDADLEACRHGGDLHAGGCTP